MAHLPVKNTSCYSPSVFGGFQHTLFLGCSIMSFSASAGWNEQQSEVTIQLVVDDCAPPVGKPKLYYDTNLSPQNWTLADPGFFGLSFNIIGTPAYFRVGDFEFSGVIQGWEETGSESGNPTYSVKLLDPRQIMENAQMIINEYAGGVGSVYNLINAFGYMESFGPGCPEVFQSAPGVYSPGNGSVDGTVFGSPAGSYGGADVNHNGMQWNQIRNAQRLLLSSFPAINNPWSPYGRLVSRASATIPASGMGLMPANVGSLAYYYLDISEVPNMPIYWRLNGTNTSIMDAITQVCQDSGYDYYVELVPVVGGALGSGIHKFIKVRTANRNLSPALNSIDTFINAPGREVISYSKGREFRNELTQSFVIGGPKISYYQAEQSDDPEGDGDPEDPLPVTADDMIIPYFGLSLNGNVIIPDKDDDDWWFFDAPAMDLRSQLGNAIYGKTIPALIELNEKEIIMAQSSFDAWMSYASSRKTDLWQALDISISGVYDVTHIIKFAANANLNNNKPRAADIINTQNGALKPKTDPDKDMEVAQIAYSWINKFATEYYGKKYQVRVPFTCGRTDSESLIIQTSEQPTDSGWTEFANVLGLPNNSVYTDFFSTDDNKISAMCRFNDAENIEAVSLSIEDFLRFEDTDEDILFGYVKVYVDEEYQYLDRSTLFSPRAIITLPQTLLQIEDIGNQTVQKAYRAIADILDEPAWQGAIAGPQVNGLFAELMRRLGSFQLHLAATQRAVIPDAVGFGIKSNVLSYGPWGSTGVAGGVNVIHDDGLVPWEYGGFTTLNLAGLAIASQGITNQQVSEEGSITVAGYPNVPLGAELLSADSGGPFDGGGNALVENRTVGSGTVNGIDFYFAGVFPWDGTYGPNVTGLTTRVGPDGLQTTYEMRTWTPKFGLFARYNAQRIKQIGQQRLGFAKGLRSFARQRLVGSNQLSSFRANINLQNRPGIALNQGALAGPKTPHELLVGQLGPWNDGEFTRPMATTMSTIEAPVEMADDYDEKAFMSLDGLIRPVSMDGSGGLPRFATLTDVCQRTNSAGSQPPIDKFGEAGSYSQYNTRIDVDYLNPFTNPSGTNRSDVTTNYSDTPNHGHDIEMIGRGETPPASSIGMAMQGYADTEDVSQSDYAADYRMLALRGPLLLQGWGYDLDGFPVPNKVDSPSAAASGQYEDTGLQKKFMDNWLRKSETWPVGPVDLRWDRGRGVWTIPQFRNLLVRLDERLSANGSATATRIDGPTLYDVDGTEITEPQVIIHDRVGNPIPSGQNAIVSFDPYECEYSVIESRASSSGEGAMFKFYLLECVCSDFNHRPEGYARAMRQTWNDSDNSWIDDEEVRIFPSCNNFGPVESGACGWANEVMATGTGIDSSGSSGALVWIEEMAQYIDFTTTENPGCNDSECLDTGLRNTSTAANLNSSWNGREPQGDVFVKWPSYVDLSCLPGYDKCDSPGDLVPYHGIAVLNKAASDSVICGSEEEGCYNSGNCGTWIYNIIEYDNPLRIQKVDCSGEPTDNAVESRLLKLGRGLDIAESDSCSVAIETTHKIGSSSCCLTEQSGYTKITEPVPFEYLNIGAGLYLFEDKVGNDCNVVTPSGECGPVHLMAGFTADNSETCTISGELTTDGTRFFNHIDFQSGLKAYDNKEESCGIIVRAGIGASGTSRCIVEDDEIKGSDIYSHIEFASGLIVRDKDSKDCKIEVSAGTSVITGDGCFGKDGFGHNGSKGNITDPDNFFNIFNFGRGFRLEANEESLCQLDIQSGFYAGTTNTCISGEPDSSTIHSSLIAGKGIKIETHENCEAYIGSGLFIKNSTDPCFGSEDESDVEFANMLYLGEGLRAKQFEEGDDCNALIIAGFKVEDQGTKCLESSDTGNVEFASTLIGGKGIRIGGDEESECDAYISAGTKMIHAGTSCISTPSTINFVSELTSAKGIRFQATDECSGLIGAGIDLTSTDTCIKADLDGSLAFVSDIEFGAGIRVSEGASSCMAIVGAGMKIIGSDSCVTGGDTVDFANNITFGKGLSVEEGGDCAVSVGLNFVVNKGQVSGINFLENTGLKVSGNADCDIASVSINYGCGLKVSNDELELDFTVNGGNVSGISFSECFIVTGNEKCGTASVTLNTSAGVASKVEYVTDVYCNESGDMVVETQYMQFSACGLFLGVST